MSQRGNEAAIGFDSLLWQPSVTLDASSGDPDALRSGRTGERWAPDDATPTLTVSGYGTQAITYLAIVAHTLGSNGVTVTAETGSGQVLLEASPEEDDTLMALFPATTAGEITITLSGPAEIGVVMLGEALRMERRIYGGHAPARLHQQYGTIVANGGNAYLGQIQRWSSVVTEFAWSNLTTDFVREDLREFRDYFDSGRPFVVSWRPLTWPDEAVYCWRSGDPMQITNSGPRDLMSASISVEGYDGDA